MFTQRSWKCEIIAFPSLVECINWLVTDIISLSEVRDMCIVVGACAAAKARRYRYHAHNMPPYDKCGCVQTGKGTIWNKISPRRRCISPYDRLTTEIKSRPRRTCIRIALDKFIFDNLGAVWRDTRWKIDYSLLERVCYIIARDISLKMCALIASRNSYALKKSLSIPLLRHILFLRCQITDRIYKTYLYFACSNDWTRSTCVSIKVDRIKLIVRSCVNVVFERVRDAARVHRAVQPRCKPNARARHYGDSATAQFPRTNISDNRHKIDRGFVGKDFSALTNVERENIDRYPSVSLFLSRRFSAVGENLIKSHT